MGYFKQQNKDLFGSHHLMYQRYQPPKDSYDMIYGGFQSMGVPLNHPFQMGIFHETTIQRAWGSLMELPGKTAWDQPNDLVGSIGSSRFNPPMAWDRLRRGKAMLSIAITQTSCWNMGLPGIFLRFPYHRQIARRIEKLCGFRRLFARVGYVWGIKPG